MQLLSISYSTNTIPKLHKKCKVRAILKTFVICEILHFRNFKRNVVYFPLIKDLATLQVPITLNGINMKLFFLKKKIHCLLKKVAFCQILHFTAFLKYFFLCIRWTLKNFKSYLRLKCYQCNGKVSRNGRSQSCF